MNARRIARTNVAPASRWDRETALVAQFAACVSFVAFVYYLQHGDLLLYGDAVAHINIARRVFDSRTPGLLQLGTVWLPLPHLLMIPFVLSSATWQSGIGGSIPSMIAYAMGAAGIFRLVRGAIGSESQESSARIAAWSSAIIYFANPNLIYLQSTAMTELLYMALAIWSVVYFAEFVQDRSHADKGASSSSLIKCGLCLLAACLTRYDGWLLSCAVGVAALALMLRTKANVAAMRLGLAKFLVLAAAAPVLWLAYNAIIYRNPLEFANGPYSARAIEQKTATPGYPPHPGEHNLPVAFSFFLKSGELNMAEGAGQKLWVAALLAGAVMILFRGPKLWPLLLLWLPLLFYTLSVAYSGVPIFLPVWWPFSFYNVRYGLQLVPAFAVAGGVIVYSFLGMARDKTAKAAVVLTILILLAGSYASVWWAQPICFREASINSRTRIAFEAELANNLKKLPPDSLLLMYLGDHVGALQQAGIPLRRVISEGSHRTWKRPLDPQGLWEHALADPARYVDYVVAMEDDPVARGVNRQGLSSMTVIDATGQPPATIYWSHRPVPTLQPNQN